MGPDRETLREKVDRHLCRRIVTRRLPLGLDRGTVSFSFDDVPVSAATTGAEILEARGARGTFYVCGGLAGTRSAFYDLAGPDQITSLARRGHEIGCHTATHANAGRTGVRAYLSDVAENARILEPLLGGAGLASFAYPYGAARLPHKLALQRRFRVCRGIHGGPASGVVDRGRLAAVALEDAGFGEAGIDAVLDRVRVERAWLVFYSHDVSDAPTRFGVRPDHLAYAVDGARARGLAIETVRGVLDRLDGALTAPACADQRLIP